jgi:putative restriction endonuclease
MVGPLDERDPAPLEDPLERRYGVREARVRLHQARFRGRVLVAYYRVHVSRRLLEDEDGPMLELLKTSHQQTIELPSRRAWRPDPERLALRFERFSAAAG